MTIAPSVCRTLSTLRHAGSGSSTGKQLREAAICPLRVEHFVSNLSCAGPALHQECGRSPFTSPLTECRRTFDPARVALHVGVRGRDPSRYCETSFPVSRWTKFRSRGGSPGPGIRRGWICGRGRHPAWRWSWLRSAASRRRASSCRSGELGR